MDEKLTCVECGEEYDKPPKGRPPKVCGTECKETRSKRQHKEKYERNKDYILERNRKYREPRKEEIAAKTREKRKEKGDEIRARDRGRYQLNPEPKRASRRASYQKHRDRFRQRNHENYLKNREEYIENARQYREKYGDLIRERRRQLYAENPARYNTRAADRRAQINEAFVESVSINVLLTRDAYLCGICGGDIPEGLPYGDPLYPHIDHIVPLSKGGEHSYVNTQPAHASCNVQKGDKVDGWQNIKPIIPEVLDGSN